MLAPRTTASRVFRTLFPDPRDRHTFTPIAFDRGGNSFTNASAQMFWHHCVTY